MTENIKEMIESMTTDEMKQRLAEYMAADQQLAPRSIAVEVRLSNIKNVRCRYDVLLIAENGQETEVKLIAIRVSFTSTPYSTHKAINVVWQLPTTTRHCDSSTLCSISKRVMHW